MRAVVGIVGLVFVLGCGTVLQVTDDRLTAAVLAEFRRGAGELQCRELASKEFALFLVCPAKDHTLGVSATAGMTTFTCKDLFPEPCERFVRHLREAGCRAGRESE